MRNQLRATTVGLMVVLACNSGPTGPQPGEILVSAAASLTDAFTEMEAAFEAGTADLDVILNFGSSAGLRQQIMEGAPVDVFASANVANMDQVVESGQALQAQIFARNELQIAVPAGNPAGIRGLADLAKPDLLIGLCAEEAPCGDYARQSLAKAGVVPSLDTNEPDVRALLTKIAAGELDAGITFRTDVLAAGGAADGVDIPGNVNVTAGYPIAVLVHAPNPGAASAFVEFVLGSEGQAILHRLGFLAP